MKTLKGEDAIARLRALATEHQKRRVVRLECARECRDGKRCHGENHAKRLRRIFAGHSVEAGDVTGSEVAQERRDVAASDRGTPLPEDHLGPPLGDSGGGGAGGHGGNSGDGDDDALAIDGGGEAYNGGVAAGNGGAEHSRNAMVVHSHDAPGAHSTVASNSGRAGGDSAAAAVADDERGVKRPRDSSDGDSEDGEAHVPMATASAESSVAPEVAARKHVSFANVLVSEVRCARYDDACSTRDLGGGSEPAVGVEPTEVAVGGMGGEWREPTSLLELLADGDDGVLFPEAAERPDPSVRRRDTGGDEEPGAGTGGKRKYKKNKGHKKGGDARMVAKKRATGAAEA